MPSSTVPMQQVPTMMILRCTGSSSTRTANPPSTVEFENISHGRSRFNKIYFPKSLSCVVRSTFTSCFLKRCMSMSRRQHLINSFHHKNKCKYFRLINSSIWSLENWMEGYVFFFGRTNWVSSWRLALSPRGLYSLWAIVWYPHKEQSASTWTW